MCVFSLKSPVLVLTPVLPAVFPFGKTKVPSDISTVLLKVAAVPVTILSVEATPINPAPLPKKLVAVID